MNLTEGAAKFIEIGVAYEANIHEALDKACVVIETEAKSYPGEYQTGWAPLKPETIARKTTGDSPLLETGELRDSYEHMVQGKSGYVGSNDDKAVWQELGTSRGIPPRPVLELAAKTKGEEAAHAIASELFIKMIGR
jgi:phage gpG-like protein